MLICFSKKKMRCQDNEIKVSNPGFEFKGLATLSEFQGYPSSKKYVIQEFC